SRSEGGRCGVAGNSQVRTGDLWAIDTSRVRSEILATLRSRNAAGRRAGANWKSKQFAQPLADEDGGGCHGEAVCWAVSRIAEVPNQRAGAPKQRCAPYGHLRAGCVLRPVRCGPEHRRREDEAAGFVDERGGVA